MSRSQPGESPGQLHLSRGMQLRILRECRLPAVEGVRPALLKAVLHTIDSHAGGNVEAWPSQETLAAEVGASYRQVQRAIAALVEQSLLCVRRAPLAGAGRCGARNYYRIVWTELRLRCPTYTPGESHRSANVLHDTTADLHDTGGRPTRHGRRDKRIEAHRNDHHLPTKPTESRVVVAVAAAGVSLAADVVPPCLARGCTAEQVLAVVAYHSTRPDLGPGALHRAIELLQPGDEPESRLPSLPPAVASEQQRARRVADDRQREASHREQAERERAERERLEQQHGAELDALTGDELAGIDAQVMGSDGQPLSAEAMRIAPASVLRERRLRVLAARATA